MDDIDSTPTVMAGIFAGLPSLRVKLVVFDTNIHEMECLECSQYEARSIPKCNFWGGSGSSLKIVSDIRGVVFRSSQVKRISLVFNILRILTPLVIVYNERR